MGFQIDELDAATAPESTMRQLAGFEALRDAEVLPDEPPSNIDEIIGFWRTTPDTEWFRLWSLRVDDTIVAVAWAFYELEQNPENAEGSVHVLKDWRGRGYARALAEPILSSLADAGKRRFATHVTLGDPGEALVERLGMRKVYIQRQSRLWIDDLDRDLMRTWIDRAAERASEYRLEYYRSPIPEEILEAFCELAFAINQAPRDDFVEDDEVLTPAIWRGIERSVADAGGELHTMIAVHEPTGQFVGYSQLKTQAFEVDRVWQWDTAVLADHQGRGLGRWIKSAMIERILADYPRVRRVDTFNSDANRAMLNINETMGFRPILVQGLWQGDLETIRQRLAQRA